MVALSIERAHESPDRHINHDRVRTLLARKIREEPSDEDMTRVSQCLEHGGWPSIDSTVASPTMTVERSTSRVGESKHASALRETAVSCVVVVDCVPPGPVGPAQVRRHVPLRLAPIGGVPRIVCLPQGVTAPDHQLLPQGLCRKGVDARRHIIWHEFRHQNVPVTATSSPRTTHMLRFLWTDSGKLTGTSL